MLALVAVDVVRQGGSLTVCRLAVVVRAIEVVHDGYHGLEDLREELFGQRAFGASGYSIATEAVILAVV